jgi:hypothetical protein
VSAPAIRSGSQLPSSRAPARFASRETTLRHQHDEREMGVSECARDTPAAWRRKGQPRGLETSVVAVRDVRLEGRRRRIEAATDDGDARRGFRPPPSDLRIDRPISVDRRAQAATGKAPCYQLATGRVQRDCDSRVSVIERARNGLRGRVRVVATVTLHPVCHCNLVRAVPGAAAVAPAARPRSGRTSPMANVRVRTV